MADKGNTILRRLRLEYYNRVLLEKGLITEKEAQEMLLAIRKKYPELAIRGHFE